MLAWLLAAQLGTAPPALDLEQLKRYVPPPAEQGPVVPAQVARWREDAKAYEHGEGGLPRDPQRAASLYCRAAAYRWFPFHCEWAAARPARTAS